MRRTAATTVALALLGAGAALGEPAGAKPRAGKAASPGKQRAKRLGTVRGKARLGLARAARPVPGSRRPGAATGFAPAPPAAVAPRPTASPALPEPAAPAAAPQLPLATPTPPPPAPLPRTVSVRSKEFSFTLSRPLVGAGLVGIVFKNALAEDPHDLTLVRSDGTAPGRRLADALPGEVIPAEADLAPGAYRLYCSLPGHEELGMRATLTVQAG